MARRWRRGLVAMGIGALVLGSFAAAPAAHADGIVFDDQSSACTNTPGNEVPGPHPQLGAVILGSLTVRADTYVGPSASGGTNVWACVVVNDQHVRVGAELPVPTPHVPLSVIWDGDTEACEATPGNLVPGGGLIIEGSILDHPWTQTYAGAYVGAGASGNGEAMVCVEQGGIRLRVGVVLPPG